MSGKAIRETLAALGVIASMVFVGMEIRTSNVQARAAAYQAIGIATAEWHDRFDDRLNRLYTESGYPESMEGWTLSDWDKMKRAEASGLRLVETVLLQVEQGLLPADAMARLGYDWIATQQYLTNPASACLWLFLRGNVGPSLRELVEATPSADRVECPIDVQSLQDQTILGDATG